MCIGEKHFSYAVTSFPDNKLSSLGYYSNEYIDGKLLSAFFSTQGWQENTFYRVLVNFEYAQSVLVPQQFHQLDQSILFLQTMTGDTTGTEIISEAIAGYQVNNVFTVPKDVSDGIKNHFPNIYCRHYYTTAIHSEINQEAVGCLFLDFKPGSYSLIVFNGKNVLMAQTYYYLKPEDVIFNLLKTCNRFSFSQDDVLLKVSGLIERQSALFKELYQFFLRIEYRNAPDWGSISSGEVAYPAHYFTTLNDLARCAS